MDMNMNNTCFVIKQSDESIKEAVDAIDKNDNEWTMFGGLTAEQQNAIFDSKNNGIEYLATQLKDSANSIYRVFYGIFINNEPIGYLAIKEHPNGINEIQIEIIAAHRNKGYGNALLSYSLTKEFEKNENAVFEYWVNSRNINSIKLIEGVGGKRVKSDNYLDNIWKEIYIINKQLFQQL